MSLLLDALKKASKDKHQKDEIKNETAVSLELDLNEDTEEDFSQVEKKYSKIPVDKKDDFSKEDDIQDKKPIKLEIESIEDEPVEKTSVKGESKKPEKINHIPEPERNEQALSALINKTKAYQKYQYKKNIAWTALFITVVIIVLVSYWMYLNEYQNNVIYNDVSPKATLNIGSIKKTPTLILTRAPIKQEVKSTRSILLKENKAQLKNKIKIKEKKPAPKKLNTGLITVTRSKAEDPIDSLLQKAYRGFQKGDYMVSLETYQKVLRTERYNRDALLGVAANYGKLNQKRLSMQAYQQVLKLDPNDSYALAAMAMLSEVKYKNESEIKILLRQQPNKAHLHFALGTFYSNKNKWPAAQSAYFKAWALENKNADYAYNLAVSLDHIGQAKEAVKFYRVALEYNLDKNIDIKNIQKRINLLLEKAKNKAHD